MKSVKMWIASAGVLICMATAVNAYADVQAAGADKEKCVCASHKRMCATSKMEHGTRFSAGRRLSVRRGWSPRLSIGRAGHRRMQQRDNYRKLTTEQRKALKARRLESAKERLSILKDKSLTMKEKRDRIRAQQEKGNAKDGQKRMRMSGKTRNGNGCDKGCSCQSTNREEAVK